MIGIPPALQRLQPDTSAAFQRALDGVLPYTDAKLLTLCADQLRAAQQREIASPPGDLGEYEQAALRLADQFAVNVSGIDEAQLSALTALAGESAVNALVNALYLLDMSLRLEAVVPVVLPDADSPAVSVPATPSSAAPVPGAGQDSASSIAATIADFAAAAVLATDVDAITTELVRLRCAQIHHCRLCGSLRQQSALDEGFDEDMAARVARYEEGGFSDATVAALRLVDAIILLPADADDALRAALAEHFSSTQIAELCFDVVKWSQQKALVATHVDAPPWEGTHVLDFDKQGHPVFNGPLRKAG